MFFLALPLETASALGKKEQYYHQLIMLGSEEAGLVSQASVFHNAGKFVNLIRPYITYRKESNSDFKILVITLCFDNCFFKN